MAPRKAGRKHRAKKEPTEREKLLERIKDMGDGEFAEVQDLISGSSQGESIQGLTGTVGVDTAAPPTAFPVRRTLGDNVPDDGGKGGGMLGKLKGLVSGPPIETTTRGPRKSNRPGTMHRTEVKKEAASSGSNVGAGYQHPLGTPAPTAGAGREVTSSQRASEAAKRAYLAQQERTRGAGGGGGPVNTQDTAIQMPETTVTANRPHPKDAPDRFKNAPQNQPPMDQAIRGPAASAMTQGNTTGTQSTNPKRKIGNFQKDGAGGYEDFGQSPVTPSPKKGGNPLTEGSFSTAGMMGNAAIKDPFAAEKASQGPQMRAPIKDSGAMRAGPAAEQEANRLEAEISNLMKMGGPAAKDRLEEIFGMLQAQEGNKAGTPGRDRQGAAGTGNRAGGRPNQRRLDTQVSNRQGGQQLPQVFVDRILRQHGAQWRAIQQGDTVRGTHGGARAKGVRR
jgi:hypothetical protein